VCLLSFFGASFECGLEAYVFNIFAQKPPFRASDSSATLRV
jgi:hypothetical protein